MIRTPITKILFNRPKGFEPCIKAPYKVAESNEFFEKTELGKKILEKLIDIKINKFNKTVNKAKISIEDINLNPSNFA